MVAPSCGHRATIEDMENHILNLEKTFKWEVCGQEDEELDVLLIKGRHVLGGCKCKISRISLECQHVFYEYMSFARVLEETKAQK